MNILGERWEHEERGDYDLDRFDKEFRDRLYSDKGREILRAQSQDLERQNNGMETIEELKQSVVNWKDTAAQAQRNTTYYQGLLDQIGETLGEAAHISDDGTRQEGVLRAKLPELAKQQLSDSKARECAMREALKAIKTVMSGSAPIDRGVAILDKDRKEISAALEALASTGECPHEQRVREMEADLKTERERFDWLVGDSYEAFEFQIDITAGRESTPDEWRAEIDKARSGR